MSFDRDYYYSLQDENCLSVQLQRAHDRMRDKYLKEREQEEMEERILENVLKKLQIIVKDEASPALKDIKNQLDNIFK